MSSAGCGNSSCKAGMQECPATLAHALADSGNSAMEQHLYTYAVYDNKTRITTLCSV
jgi:hypothetical protein